MPLDGHSYLVAQGWSGRGNGLRKDAISRPLAVPQKRTLSGLGKDRDEAFPFWDHLFTVAAKTIQVKIHKDEDDSSDTGSSMDTPTLPPLSRTCTGILSNKRPSAGTPASLSGSTTPSLVDPSPSTSSNGYRMSLIAVAKRDAAKRCLYSRFFRGPVLGPDDGAVETKDASASARSNETPEFNGCEALAEELGGGNTLMDTDEREDRKTEMKRQKKGKSSGEAGKEKKEKKRKDKGKEKVLVDSVKNEAGDSKRKRKRIRPEVEDNDVKISKKEKKRKRSTDVVDDEDDSTKHTGDYDRTRSKKMTPASETAVENAGTDTDRESRSKGKEERRRRKEEKERRKEKKGKRRRKEADESSS